MGGAPRAARLPLQDFYPIPDLNQILTHPAATQAKISADHSTIKGFNHTMRHLAASLKSGWTWWWGFGLLIALPALALALLGLRAVRAERIEREQQVREQQTQIARLADAALANALSELENAQQRALAP